LQCETGFFVVVPGNQTIHDLKCRIYQEQITHNLAKIQPENQRIIHRGAVLTPDNTQLKYLNFLQDDPVFLHLIERNNPEQVRGNNSGTVRGNNPVEIQADNILARARASRLNEVLTHAWVLQENFQSCIDATQTNQEPGNRVLYHIPRISIPDQPTVRDLGYLCREISNATRQFARNLEHLADFLAKDEKLPNNKNDEKYKSARRMFQNNMDAAKFLAPELKNFSQFIIPLGDEPPRVLSIVDP
jgi:hypothetical protein